LSPQPFIGGEACERLARCGRALHQTLLKCSEAV
jgi:hypothetical protein